MRIQQRWFLLAAAAICTLSSLAATSPDAPTSTPGTDLVPGVEPLEPTKEKEMEMKSGIDGKKKLTIELKPKHHKKTENLTTEIAPTVPLLVRGEPVVKAEEEEVSSRGRALNMSAPEPTNSLHANLTDLSDVSMDDEDKEVEGGEYVAVHNETEVERPVLTKFCAEGNKTYAVGEKVVRGCDEKCVCGEDGKVGACEPVCALPFVRAGKSANDPLCHERLSPTEPCCAVLVCAQDSEPEPDETCLFENTTLTRGQRVEDKCERICVCEARGHLKCEPRCPPNDTTSKTNQSDRCVVLQDPTDKCCTITLCDVTLGDHEIKADNPSELSINITDVKVLNSTAIKIKLSTKSLQDVSVEISENNHDWRQVKPTEDGIISDLEPAHSYYVRILENGRAGPAFHVSLFGEVTKTNVTDKLDKKMCHHRGKSYDVGSQWYDECIAICVCLDNGKPQCATIECPTDFGLDVLDPHCLDWETVPPNHVPKAPNCCPEEIRCKNNGSCLYEGQMYENWSELPSNVTGCEKRCYCDMGNVSCQAACPPVPAEPPSSLHCPPHQAKLAKLPGDDCCQKWVCDPTSAPGLDTNLPPSFHLSPSAYPSTPTQMSDEVTVQELEPLSEHSVRLVFSVPNLYVGLHGRVELRYTSDKANMDPSTWKSQIFAPKDGLIATPQLEFELDGLQPATEYRVKITVKLKDLNNSPASKIYSIKTLDKHATISTLPPQIPVDAELRIMETNSTWVNVMWKKLAENELQFIDGVQLRYKEFDGKVYAATPLIHRSVTNYVLENLKPSTIYEIGIYFIPFPGQTTELISEKTIQVKTSTEPDPYAFDVKVEIKAIKSSEVEVSWSGVPYPEDKYVNIYRAIYQNDNGKEDTSTFKIAKRDSPAKTTISDLKPGTRYRLWIEVYLTNGRIKKSNVQDFVTKPGVVLSAGASTQGKLASVPLHEGDYYGPLVIVAIVASLSILSTLILLMMLMKRRTSSKADISPRKTTSAYDNPSYKVELQQETMDL